MKPLKMKLIDLKVDLTAGFQTRMSFKVQLGNKYIMEGNDLVGNINIIELKK